MNISNKYNTFFQCSINVDILNFSEIQLFSSGNYRQIFYSIYNKIQYFEFFYLLNLYFVSRVMYDL